LEQDYFLSESGLIIFAGFSREKILSLSKFAFNPENSVNPVNSDSDKKV